MTPIIEFLNRIGGGFCNHALWMFVQVSILVGIVWGLDLVLRNQIRASVRYCIWLLVLLKLVLPVDLRLPSGFGYWLNLETKTPAPIREVMFVQPSAKTEPTKPLTSPAPVMNPVSEIADQEPRVLAEQTVQAAVPSLTLAGLVFGLWLAGVCCLTCVLGVQFAIVRNVIGRSQKISAELCELLKRCQSALGMRRTIGICESEDVGSPAVCGIFRPIILIPSGLTAKLSTEQLEKVLLHELMHVKRGDLWVNLVQNGLQVFYFYHPLVRFANGRIRTAREQANDEQVLVHLKGERADYSATLIEIAAAAVGRPMPAVRLIGVAEPKTHLHERITLMMQKPIPKTARLGVLGTLTVLLLALTLLPMAGRMQAVAAERKSADVPAITLEQFLAEVKPMYQNMLKADAGAMTSDYAEDAVMLAGGANPAIGKKAIVEMVNDSLQKGERFVAADVQFQEIRRSGRYVLSLDRGAFTVRTPLLPHLLQAYCLTVTVFEVQPDGTLKSKVEAWNYEQPPAAGQLLGGTGVTAKPDAFRIDDGSHKTADASPETLESVQALDKQFHADCMKADPALVASYYAQDAIYIGEKVDAARGSDAIRASVTAIYRQLQLESIGHRIVFAEGTEDMVYVVNTFQWKGVDMTQGNASFDVPGKGLHVWQKQPDGNWKILVDINSANIQ